ncbi:MAG: glycosyltransferase family 1 protein, partial [Kiritimatiellae bacterium]|nr:glycosyltransferase family 1 protein [Kiritimatiellia bacterium]
WSTFSPANQLFFPRELRRSGIDVYHSTNYMIPLLTFPRNKTKRPRCIVTIHDLIPLKHPEFTPHALKTRFLPIFRALIREVALRADAIITVSDCSRKDLTELLHLPPKRADNLLHVIPNGVDRRFVPGPNITQRAPVILYVGRLDPYKNAPLLIRAFATLLRDIPQARLQLIGPPDPRYPEAANIIRELGIENHISQAGYLPDDELLRAYQSASVLVLPSRYEGFGLPVVEAMACATPVLCTNAASLPEIAGEAALLIPPDDEAALAQALRRILLDDSLKRHLSKAGPPRAAGYAWPEVARQTAALYHALAASQS